MGISMTGDEKKHKINRDIQAESPLKTPQEFMDRLWYALDHFNWSDSALDASSIKFLNESQKYFEQALKQSRQDTLKKVFTELDKVKFERGASQIKVRIKSPMTYFNTDTFEKLKKTLQDEMKP